MDINARQIEALDFNYLDQSETYQYSVDQLARVKLNAAILEKLGTEVNAWEAVNQAFDVAYRKVSTSLQTKVVQTLDSERDSIYTGITGMVTNMLKSPVTSQREAAEELQEPIKRYGINAGGEYQQQTMRTDQFCTDLLANYSSQLTALGLTAWVEALQAKNQEFSAAMNARTNDQASYVRSELTQLRQQIITTYRVFVKLMNVVLIYEGDTAYASTIDQMNAEVRHYRQIIARKGGGTTNGTNNTNNSNGTNEGGSEQGGGTTTNDGDDDTPPPSGGGGFPGSDEVDGGGSDQGGGTDQGGSDQGGGTDQGGSDFPPSGGGGFGG